jgi:hypothetical protein
VGVGSFSLERRAFTDGIAVWSWFVGLRKIRRNIKMHKRQTDILSIWAVTESLAVWKAQCQDAIPSGTTFRTMVELYAWSKVWMTSGWKAHKTEHGKSSAINTILDLVRPFLE